ncbi:MAG: hypothetical protein V9G04_00860 [Nocardioides sp.]|jgi:hypothetical protein
MTNSDASRLPGLSAGDTRWLLQEAEQVLRDHGHEPVLNADLAFDLPDGRFLGLGNLALTVRRLPRRKWKQCVRQQLTTLLAIDLSAPVTRDQIFAKLWPEAAAQEFAEYEPLMPLPGVAALLVGNGEGCTFEFGKLDQVGDREEAYATALDNLAALPLPQRTSRRIDPHIRDSWMEVLEARDPFSAARVLVLPHLIRRVLDRDFPESGVLVAVPNKFELWVHVPVDESVLQTALTMAWHSYSEWGQSPYAISPNIFHVSPDMRARVLVAPDQEGVDLHQQAMVDLLERLPGAHPEAV